MAQNDTQPVAGASEQVRGNIPQAFLWATTALSLYWVIFLWGFWERFTGAMGINAALFWVGVSCAFALLTPSKRPYARENLIWFVPVCCCALGYALYDNYFLNGWSLVTLPLMGGVLFIVSRMRESLCAEWPFGYLLRLIGRVMLVIPLSVPSVFVYLGSMRDHTSKRDGSATSQRILLGIFMLGIISIGLVLPLLSSADPAFGRYLEDFYEWLWNAFPLETLLNRACVFLILCALAVGAARAWLQDLPKLGAPRKGGDPIISGIVLGGIFAIYALFLAIQLERLFVGALPIAFHETERLVKTGFWQLMALSALNIVMVEIFRRVPHEVVRLLLRTFSLASLLLLASAAHRMGLYVFYYGFSYEKFYASYSVVYCALLLGGLCINLFVTRPIDAVRLGTGLFVCMYSFIAVMPVERFIVATNMRLAQVASSRLAIADMKMLSPDALGALEPYWHSGALSQDPAYRNRLDQGYRTNWDDWFKKRDEEVRAKAWYERNLGNIVYLLMNDEVPKRTSRTKKRLAHQAH